MEEEDKVLINDNKDKKGEGKPELPSSSKTRLIEKLDRAASGKIDSNLTHGATANMYYGTDLGKSDYDKELIVSQHLDADNFVKSLQEYRSRKQPVSHQIANTTLKTLVNTPLKTVSNVAYALDFEDYMNTDQEMGNWLSNLMDAGSEAVGEEYHNYRKDPNKALALDDSAWWIDSIGSIVESAGSFVLAGGALSKGITGLSRAVKAQKVAKAMMGAKNAEAAEGVTNTMLNALMLNQAEGMMEASDVMEQAFQFQKEKGLSDEDARRRAVEAGVTTINFNRSNILFNLSSASLFFRANKASNYAMYLRNMGTKANVGRATIEGFQESAEELVNLWAGKEGTAVGKEEDYSFSQLMGDLTSREAAEAAILGFVGGMAQTVGTTEGANRFMKMGDPDNKGEQISIRDFNKRQYRKAKEAMVDLDKSFKAADLGTVTEAFMSKADQLKLREAKVLAQEKEDTQEVERIEKLELASQAQQAFRSGTGDHLIGIYEAFKNGPQKEGMASDYKQKADEAISFIKDLQKQYDQSVTYEGSHFIYNNRAGRITLNKLRKDLKDVIAQNQLDLQEEMERAVEGTEFDVANIELDSKASDIEPAFKKINDKIKESEAYKNSKKYQDQLKGINTEIDKIDEQYKQLTNEKTQQVFKDIREQQEKGEVTKSEEEKIDKKSQEVEEQAAQEREQQVDETIVNEQKENEKAAQETQEEAREETENNFDKIANNYSIGETIPITPDLVSEFGEETEGTLLEIDEENGTLQVELSDGSTLSIGRDKGFERFYPIADNESDITDTSTEGGLDTKPVEETPVEENVPSTENGSDGAKMIGRNKQGDPILSPNGVAWVEEQYSSFLEFERMPEDKKGRQVGFELNSPFTDNQAKALNIYNKKVKQVLSKDGTPSLTTSELDLLYRHLPFLAKLTESIKAPIETESSAENRVEGDTSVKNFDDHVLPLRKGIIDSLIAGKDINKIFTRIQDQYKGILKVAPKQNGQVVENNLLELDYIGGDLSKLDFYVVNDDTDLESPTGEKIPGGMKGKGEIYLKIKAANGTPFFLKLNVKKIDNNQATALYAMFKYRMDNDASIFTKVSELDKAQQEYLKDKLSEQFNVLKKNKSVSDITLKDLTDILIWDLSTSERTRVLMNTKDKKFTFGNTTIDFKDMEQFKNSFTEFLTENKRNNIKFKPKDKDGNTLTISNQDYIEYLVNNKILNTNAVVNEPTFQGRTDIYLEPKAYVEGEKKQPSVESKSKKRIESSPAAKQGLSVQEAREQVDEKFKNKIIKERKRLIKEGLSRPAASKQANEKFADEIAKEMEKLTGRTAKPVEIVKETPKKVTSNKQIIKHPTSGIEYEVSIENGTGVIRNVKTGKEILPTSPVGTKVRELVDWDLLEVSPKKLEEKPTEIRKSEEKVVSSQKPTKSVPSIKSLKKRKLRDYKNKVDENKKDVNDEKNKNDNNKQC